MSKTQIATAIFAMRKTKQFFCEREGQLYGLDELLSMFYSRPVEYGEAVRFLTYTPKWQKATR